jgi:hypothetical protein
MRVAAALDVSRLVHARARDGGMVVCGTGAGAAVAAWTPPGIRAAVRHDADTAALVDAGFAGAERRVRRRGKIDVMEQEGFGA